MAAKRFKLRKIKSFFALTLKQKRPMLNIFQVGDKKYFETEVKPEDTAAFASVQVHPVYATFALGRDAEWCCRLFVLEMKEADEEGIGTFLNIKHHSPALVSSKIKFEATLLSIEKNNVLCSFEAFCGDRLIASGTQGQKIIKKEKLNDLFATL
jgi:predicted thioesterase